MDEFKQDIKEIKEDLREHIKRTALLESRQDKFDAALEPIKTHVAVRSGIEKALLTFLGAAAAIAAIWRAFH